MEKVHYAFGTLLTMSIIPGYQYGVPLPNPLAPNDRALIAAMEGNDLKGVSKALDSGADIEIDSYPVDTPLAYAAEHHKVGLARLLLARGADPNKLNSDLQAPLHYATNYCYRDIAELLLTHHANPNIRDGTGATALEYASASVPRYAGLVKVLLDHGADPNVVGKAEDVRGLSPLMSAAANGNVRVVKLLLAHRADYRLKDAKGATALAYAHEHNHHDVEVILMRAGEKE